MKNPRLLARIAGVFYLIITACALFAYLYVREQVIDVDDMARTAANFATHEQRYRLGFAAALIVCVCNLPMGFILTDLTSKLWSSPTMQAWNRQVCPMKRLGTVDDLVGTAIYLASKASDFMTGQVLYVDGGMSAGTLWPIEL